MVTGSVSYADYLAAYRLHRHRVATAMNWLMVGLTVVGALTLLGGYRWWGIVISCTSVGGLIGEFVQARIFLPWKVKKLYGQHKGIAEPITYEWDSQRLLAKGETGHGEYKWKDYAKVKEDDKVVLFYITDYLWHVVPKAWFNEPAELEEFRGYAGLARET